MIKRLTKLLLLSVFLPLLFTHKVHAERASTVPTQEMVVEAKALDPRAQILRDYFAKYDSPLQYYAQDFIDASNQYGVDWKLVPSIAGVESTFGKDTPGNFYYPSWNAWGWGVYGNQAIYFSSWREGIFTVTKGLKDDYVSKGITDPYVINYSYASSPAWGGHVAYFMSDLDTFSKAYQPQTQPVAQLAPDHQPESSSAALAKANIQPGEGVLALNP